MMQSVSSDDAGCATPWTRRSLVVIATRGLHTPGQPKVHVSSAFRNLPFPFSPPPLRTHGHSRAKGWKEAGFEQVDVHPNIWFVVVGGGGASLYSVGSVSVERLLYGATRKLATTYLGSAATA